MNKLGIFLTGFALALTTISVNAEESGHPSKDPGVGFIISAGYTDGGDELISVQFEDGENDKIKAGGKLLIAAGIAFSPSPSTEIQLTIGYHFDNLSASNGDASFERFPIDALLFRRIDRHRIGGGLTIHLSPKAEIDIDGMEREVINFDASPGLVLEYDYQVANQVWAGLRYTHIDYKKDAAFGNIKVNGNHVGLMAQFRF